MTIGARPCVGSSRISTFGSSSNARAIASICCSPPLSDPPSCVRRSLSRGKHGVDLGKAGVEGAEIAAMTLDGAGQTQIVVAP